MPATAPKSQAITGALYDLLTEKLPLCAEGGVLRVAVLADQLGMSHEGVYKWLRSGVVSRRGRSRLVQLANGADNLVLLKGAPLTEDDLRAFS